MADNDILDVKVAQPEQRPRIGSRLQKLCAYAVITVLEGHPNKESMAPTLALKREGSEVYTTEVDLRDHDDMVEVLAAARDRMTQEPSIEAYVLMVDSADLIPGFPGERPVDTEDRPYPEGTPAVAMYLGERGGEQGYLVIQPYRRRRIRGGATPIGAPLIVEGPASLLDAG